MKTTVEISDELLLKAKKLAVKRRTTLRSIIEQGLRNTLKEQRDGESHTLVDMSVDGEGLQPEFRDSSWSDIRKETYEGRGG